MCPSFVTSRSAPLPTPRTGLAAVTGRDGHIYALGGNDAQGNALPIVEAYDPVSRKWKTIKPMSAPRTDLAAVTGRDGLIYAIGGEDNIYRGPYNNNEGYFP